MNQHVVQWTAPAPLWAKLLSDAAGAPVTSFSAPAILRFASDNFMQDYLDALATDPRKLGEFRAVAETWRGKLPQPVVPTPARSFALGLQRLGSIRRRPANTGDAPGVSSDAENLQYLKLYQPAHLRHYLLSTSLVCQQTGLPDRHVDAGRNERVSFVIRRLFLSQANSEPLPDDSADEYAWVAVGNGNAWVKVVADGRTNEKVVLEGEERLPLFPARFTDDDQRTRRLFAGVIPVGKRETYLAGQRRETLQTPTGNGLPQSTTPMTARKILLRKQVIEPWKALITQIATANSRNSVKVSDDGTEASFTSNLTFDSTRSAREQAQVISWLILSDLAEFLSLHIPELWQAVIAGSRPGAAQPNVAASYDALVQAKWPDSQAAVLQKEYDESGTSHSLGYPTLPATLRDALAQFGQGTNALNDKLRQSLDGVDQPYSRLPGADRSQWPDFLFPLTDPQFGALPVPDPSLGTLQSDEKDDLSVDTELQAGDTSVRLDKFAVLLVRAMAESKFNGNAPQPEIPSAAILPASLGSAVFLIRCVYERPACGTLQQDVISDPTERFELAGFFDPDAPARPIRIGLPIDTTPAGLRKFDKNTAFIISDVLCGQIQRVKGLGLGDLIRSVLPWPLHKDLSVGDMKPCGSGSTNFGMVCSLSIPIITICALILLLMIVLVLDFVFRWMPFFIICFPIPGLKAKK